MMTQEHAPALKDPFARHSIRTGVFYRDPDRALNWLRDAFGLAVSMDVRDSDGALVHGEMSFGGSSIVIDSVWADFVTSPLSTEGRNTQIVYIQLQDGIEAHCAHAKQNGAQIVEEPTLQHYGAVVYRARDFEGHIWTFSQAREDVGKAEFEARSGVSITGWHRD